MIVTAMRILSQSKAAQDDALLYLYDEHPSESQFIDYISELCSSQKIWIIKNVLRNCLRWPWRTLATISYCSHKPNDRWGNDYAEEKSLLFHLLCNMNLVRISHIGSTSIQAIWAKPIIDILIEMSDNSSFNDIYKILLEHDYICMIKSERRMDFNKGYTKFGFADKAPFSYSCETFRW